MQAEEDLFDNCEDQFEFSDYKSDPNEAYFDRVVGALQDIVISEAFENMQRVFMKKYVRMFDNAEENKPQYMGVFKQYQTEMESFIHKQLASSVKDFDMGRFLQMLETRHEQIDDQLLDMLTSLSDFMEFKTLMVDFKNHYDQEERIQLLTIKTKKVLENKKVKGANTIFSGGQGFQLQKSSEMLIEEMKKEPIVKPPPNKMKPSLNIKQDPTGQFQPDLILSVRPLRKH